MKARIAILATGCVFAAVVVMLLGQLGFPALFVVAWMIVLLAIVLAFRQDFIEIGALWPPEKMRRDSRSSEVSRMAWAINTRTGVVGHVVVRRVQSLLRRRLAHQGLDLDDPAQHARIDALLGEGVRDALHRREIQRTDIELVLDAIDRIPNDLEETG
ncbi:hypothetical protein ACI2IP_13965 [Microbacterium sp. NPDC090218]